MVEKSQQALVGVSLGTLVALATGLVGVQLGTGCHVAVGMGVTVAVEGTAVAVRVAVGVGIVAKRTSLIRFVKPFSNPGRPGPVPKNQPTPASATTKKKVSNRPEVIRGR